MEVIGGIASVVGITTAAASAAQAAGKLCVELKDAPSQLAEIRSRVDIFKVVLDELSKPEHDSLIPDNEKGALIQVIRAVQETLLALQEKCSKLPRKSGVRARVKWTILTQHSIKSLEAQLHSRQMQLLTCIGVRNYLAQLTSTQSIEKSISKTLKGQFDSSSTAATPLGQLKQIDQIVLSSISSLGRVKRHIHEPSRRTADPLPSWLSWLGFTGSTVQISKGSNKIYVVLARLQLPSASGGYNVAYLAEFIIRFGSALPSMSISTYNIVPEDAPIMKACAQGNLSRVQQLLQVGEASVDDVTPSHDSPLFHAINSGNTSLVRFLLNNGANVNRPFGSNDTSPLQWALFKRRIELTRLFIERGASGDYISALRWTPLFYLLVDHSEKAVLDKTSNTIEFLRILSNDDLLLDLEVRDKDNMTILDHTVRYGTGDEVKALLQLGAEIAPKGKDPWKMFGSAMSQAIVSANFSTYLALFPYYQPHLNSEFGSWSMLHLAAYMGRDDMVRHLLENGAEEFYVDIEEEFEMGQSIGERDEHRYQFSMTYDTYTKYMQALYDFRKIDIISDETENGRVEDIFWDTNEEY